MFPQSRVDVLVIRQVISMPAMVVIGFWIVLQLFSGVGSPPTRQPIPGASRTWPTSAAS